MIITNRIKGKKGDVPIYILVIGILALCALMMISFTISIKQIEQKFVVLELLGQVNSNAENFDFYKNPEFGKTSNEAIDIIDKKYVYIGASNVLFHHFYNLILDFSIEKSSEDVYIIKGKYTQNPLIFWKDEKIIAEVSRNVN